MTKYRLILSSILLLGFCGCGESTKNTQEASLSLQLLPYSYQKHCTGSTPPSLKLFPHPDKAHYIGTASLSRVLEDKKPLVSLELH